MIKTSLSEITFTVSDEEKEEITQTFEETFGAYLLERIQKELPSLLSWRNFIGEAEVYMYINDIPQRKDIVEQYAKAMYKEFIDNMKDMVYYSETDKCLKVSPYITSLEFGDFYRPAAKFLSNMLTEFLQENNL